VTPAEVAYHEAGHAAAWLALGVPFHSVTVVPRGPCLGAVFFSAEQAAAPDPSEVEPPPLRFGPDGRHLAEREATGILAGPAAQAGYALRFRPGGAADVDLAFACARAAVPAIAVRPWLRYVWALAAGLLTDPDRWYAVEAIAEALTARGTLAAAEARELAARGRYWNDPAVDDRLVAAARFLARGPGPLFR
jgi:hypothetical protein